MPKIKILVVEDEVLVAKDISERLRTLGYEIIGIAPTVKRALPLMEKLPDIVLIDIVLKGDMDGIELGRIINKHYQIPFIFLTSHADTYFVERAKSVNPHAYILKPFNDRQLSVAIELALVNFAGKTPEENLINPTGFSGVENQALYIKDSLFLKKDNHFERVFLQEIMFFKADSNYTTIYTKYGRFVYSMVLRKMETLLPFDVFMRIHRSYIANINQITGFEGNMLYIGDHKIPVSKANRDEVFKLFRKI